jgi:hypothetical protein
MTSRRWVRWTTALGLGLALAAPPDARGQFGSGFPVAGQFNAGFPSAGQFGISPGYGPNALGGIGAGPTLGYGIRTGQIGGGYGLAGGLYGQAYAVPRAQTTVALQPLYSAITSLPGWDGPTRRYHRRARHARYDPPIPHYDRDGKILWPGMIHDDLSSGVLRREAEIAFEAVFRESKSTGHASIRPVIHAKEKLSAYERQILPGIKGRSVPDGDYLERFFVDLDRSLDAMNSVF